MKVWVYLTSALLCIAMLSEAVRADLQTGGGNEDRSQGTVGNWIKFFETNTQWASVTILDFLKYLIKVTYFTVGYRFCYLGIRDLEVLWEEAYSWGYCGGSCITDPPMTAS